MQRLIIVSNRLPVTVEKRHEEIVLRGSVGGVATGLSSFHKAHESCWVGWADVGPGRLDAAEREHVRAELDEHHSCVPVFLGKEDVRGFYHGFSNRTLWPLFHHFTQYAAFDQDMWAAYERVNRKYRDAVLETARPGDTIWIQDYQLMLLPAMLRESLPDATIGFFLHIPFPSFEIFRMLPWRRRIIEGLLGADLVGFHTYDYVRHFLASARRLVGVEDQYGRIDLEGRVVLVDAFPMGIDYGRYENGARTPLAVSEADRIAKRTEGRKIVLSVDRLDYTKGIPERLRAFDTFLQRHPEWRNRVNLVCVAVPSRTRVEQYKALRAEVDELVGRINGRHSTIDWTPIRYLYRSLPFDTLCGMYAAADVALVTPLRDGMNLVAKEYLATRTDGTGVLLLSEMAGAAHELGEAVQVNPFDHEAMVEAIDIALRMPEEEQRARNSAMQERLKRYTVQRWAEEFLGSLEGAKFQQVAMGAHLLHDHARERLIRAYADAPSRLLMLDYDGSLVPFANQPEGAIPPPQLLELVARLAADGRNEVVLISGRDRASLDAWFGHLPVSLVAEHGVWLKERSDEWVTITPMSDEWKPRVRPLLEMYVDRTAGAFIEEKEYSLVWHYRKVDPQLAATRVRELREALMGVAGDLDLAVMEGNRVLEIKSAGVDKGKAVHRWTCRGDVDFVLVVGDDRTDEDSFDAAPDTAWTLKIGGGDTRARFSVPSYRELRSLLADLAETDSATEADADTA